MKMSEPDKPLTAEELGRLEQLLAECAGDEVMNPEELDGFFSALIAGPEMVLPSEYLPEVFGGDMPEVSPFASIEEANAMLGLLMRHWNTIATTLEKTNPTSRSYWRTRTAMSTAMTGRAVSCEAWTCVAKGWAGLLESDGPGYLFPMLLLCHENDPDPQLRPPPVTPEKREELLVLMAAGLHQSYQYFKPQRQAEANAKASEYRRSRAKIGRNDPCPCGSGKKYKQCHGSVTVQ